MFKNIFRPTLVGIFLLLIAVGTHAASLTITNTFDDAPGSLREAIVTAITNGEANVVTFNIPTSDSGYNPNTNQFTISLLSPLPSIPLAAFTLTNSQAEGVTISGNGSFRVFTSVDNAVVTFNNITIANGSSGSPVLSPGLRSAAGDNTAGLGGGIYMGSSSTLDLNECVVIGNTASIQGGGIYLATGAEANISKSTITGNTAPFAYGGAIFNSANGTLNIDSSTVSSNSAYDGGGIYNANSGTINATTSTFDGNSANGYGGAIYNGGTIAFTNNTITANTAGYAGGICNDSTATLNNNIVAMNSAPTATDLGGGFSYAGNYNLIGNADGSSGLASSPNISGTTGSPIDPMLGPLQDNGGKTHTRAVLTGSPAIDSGSTTLLLDQREALRPFDSAASPNGSGNASDMGAYEYRLGPSRGRVNVGGRVFLTNLRCESGLSSARVTIMGMDGSAWTVATGSDGNYRFDAIPAGGSYIVNVRLPGYSFDSRIILVQDNTTDVNFSLVSDSLSKCSR